MTLVWAHTGQARHARRCLVHYTEDKDESGAVRLLGRHDQSSEDSADFPITEY
jgi:hypothetical protein